MQKSTSKHKLIFNSIIYSFSGILLKCFSFFLLPLYTAYLTTEDYGITSISSSFITTAGYIVTFSLFSAVARYYVDLKDNPEKLKRFYGTIVIFIMCSNIVFFILATLGRSFLTKYIFSGIDYFPIILVTLISLAFYCQQTIYINMLQSQQRAVKSSILSIVFFLFAIILNIFFVVILKMGALGSILASLVGYILYTIYFITDMIKNDKIEFCLDINLLKEALRYSIPIIPHNLSTQISVLLSKVLIGGSVSISGVGIYSVASQFGGVADTIQSYVDRAYGPWLYEKLHYKEEGFKDSIRSISNMLASVLGVFFLGIALFAQDYIILFLDKSYVMAWKFVPFIVLVFAIKTAYYFYVEILFYYKEASRKLFISTLSSSLVNIFLTYFMVPILGIYGSILADLVAMIIRVVIVIIISKKFNNIGLYVKDFIMNFLILMAFICIGLSLSYFKYGNYFSFYNFFFKIIIVIVYVSLIILKNKKKLIFLINRFIKNSV